MPCIQSVAVVPKKTEEEEGFWEAQRFSFRCAWLYMPACFPVVPVLYRLGRRLLIILEDWLICVHLKRLNSEESDPLFCLLLVCVFVLLLCSRGAIAAIKCLNHLL